MARQFGIGTLGALVLACAGCGGGGGGGGSEATGSVLLDGKPLANAQVQFIAKEGSAIHTATTDAAGKFTLKESAGNNPLQPGAYVVTVSKATVPSGGMGATVNEVPPVYQNQGRTPLHADLQAGKNDLPPFELRSQGEH